MDRLYRADSGKEESSRANSLAQCGQSIARNWAGAHSARGARGVRRRPGGRRSALGAGFRPVCELVFEVRHRALGEGKNACRTVTIRLLSEDRTSVVRSRKLLRARVVKHTAGPLNGKDTDVAMEELVLSCAGLEAQRNGALREPPHARTVLKRQRHQQDTGRMFRFAGRRRISGGRTRPPR